MNATIELIKLQTFVLSKGETLINQSGEYKSTPEVFTILYKIWKNIVDSDEQIHFERLVAGTTYKTCK